jgi:hypothetical protein
MKFYICMLYVLCGYMVFANYSCRKTDDCIIECLNIPSKFIYDLKNISSEWFPVLQDDGNCYLHNKITGENI